MQDGGVVDRTFREWLIHIIRYGGGRNYVYDNYNIVFSLMNVEDSYRCILLIRNDIQTWDTKRRFEYIFDRDTAEWPDHLADNIIRDISTLRLTGEL